jgi:hypothetical protein
LVSADDAKSRRRRRLHDNSTQAGKSRRKPYGERTGGLLLIAPHGGHQRPLAAAFQPRSNAAHAVLADAQRLRHPDQTDRGDDAHDRAVTFSPKMLPVPIALATTGRSRRIPTTAEGLQARAADRPR